MVEQIYFVEQKRLSKFTLLSKNGFETAKPDRPQGRPTAQLRAVRLY